MRLVVIGLMLLFECQATQATAAPHLGLQLTREGQSLFAREVSVVVPKSPVLKAPPSSPSARRIAPLPAPAGSELMVASSQERVVGQLAPSQFLVRRYDPASGQLSLLEGKHPALSPSAMEALSVAPAWIRWEMAGNLSFLPHDVQDGLVGPLLGDMDPRFRDEFAFLLTNIAPEDLGRDGVNGATLLEQIVLVYEADALLDSVEIVDVEGPLTGDYWSYARYRTCKGECDDWEDIPRELYYWYVVHPKLDGEELSPIDPQQGKEAAGPQGLGVRSYFLWPPDSLASYEWHWVFRELTGQEAVDVEALKAWPDASHGVVQAMPADPLVLTADEEGRPTLAEARMGSGTVLATTLAVEEAPEGAAAVLFSNLVGYGAGNVRHKSYKRALVVLDGDALLNPVAMEMERLGFQFDTVDGSTWADIDLSPYAKVLVSSAVGEETVALLVADRERLESWLQSGQRILEWHAGREAFWDGLDLPGGVRFAGHSESGVIADIGGQPRLSDITWGEQLVWDGNPYAGLSGDRPLQTESFLLDKLTWWAGQNLFDNISERLEKTPAFVERTNYPQRIVFNHFGNCGEIQDLLVSAMRTLCIPASNVSNGPEDHVWAEFYSRGDWHPSQIDWSDGPAHIDNPGICYGKKWGGGKNISTVVRYRGDGYLENRTDFYANTFELEVIVSDREGNPVDGAEVVILTESYYEENGAYPLTVAWWGIADPQGRARLQLGANENVPIDQCDDPASRCNSYYLRVLTYWGSYPEEDNAVSLAVTHEEAVPGAQLSRAVTVDVLPPQRLPQGDAVTGDIDWNRAIRITVDGSQDMACGYGLYGGLTWCDPVASGSIELMVLDASNFESWLAEEPFFALADESGLSAGDSLTFHPGKSDIWYLLAGHQGRFQTHELVDLRFEVLDLLETGEEPGTKDVVDEWTPLDETVSDLGLEVDDHDSDPVPPPHPSSANCSSGARGEPPTWLGLTCLLFALAVAGFTVRRKSRP